MSSTLAPSVADYVASARKSAGTAAAAAKRSEKQGLFGPYGGNTRARALANSAEWMAGEAHRLRFGDLADVMRCASEGARLAGEAEQAAA